MKRYLLRTDISPTCSPSSLDAQEVNDDSIRDGSEAKRVSVRSGNSSSVSTISDNRPAKKSRQGEDKARSAIPERHRCEEPSVSDIAQQTEEQYLGTLKATAQYCRHQKDYVQARALLEKVLEVESAIASHGAPASSSTTRGSGNTTGAMVNLMVAYTDLANLCSEMGDLDAAMNNHNAALNMYLEGCPACHNIAALAIANLRHVAAIYIRCQKRDEALLCYGFIYKIQQQFEALGVIPKSEIASTFSCMGLMNYKLQRYPEALRFYREELQLRLDMHNGSLESEDVAITFNSIGIVSFQMERLDEAYSAFQSCLKIRQSLLGVARAEIDPEANTEENKNHCFDLAMVYYNLAGICMKRGDDQEAYRLYQRSMELKKAVFGNHPEIAVDYQHLGQLYLDHGDSPAAIEYYTEALKVVQSLSFEVEDRTTDAGTDNENDQPLAAAQKLLVIIGNIHLLEGNVQAMMSNFEMAAQLGRPNNDFTESIRTFGFHFYSISRQHPRCAAVA